MRVSAKQQQQYAGGAASGVRARARAPALGGQRRWERVRCGYGRVWPWRTQVGAGLRRQFKGEKRGEREEGLTVEDACELEGSGGWRLSETTESKAASSGQSLKMMSSLVAPRLEVEGGDKVEESGGAPGRAETARRGG